MRAFDVFKEDYYKEFYIGEKDVTPSNIRKLSIDNFDGRVMNNFEHVNKWYYNSHGNISKWYEIKELEVRERENYEIEEFNSWEKKYGINDNDNVIWVTPYKNKAVTYNANLDMYDEILKMNTIQLDKYISENEIERPIKFKCDEGIIIEESNDGEDGFLFLIKKQ